MILLGAAAGSAAGGLSSDTGLFLVKLHVPGAVQSSAHPLTVPGQEQDLADLGGAEVALGALKWWLWFIYLSSSNMPLYHTLWVWLVADVRSCLLGPLSENMCI